VIREAVDIVFLVGAAGAAVFVFALVCALVAL
jgi:predicted ribonuclease YlaK